MISVADQPDAVNGQQTPPKAIRRKLTKQDAEQIAKLVAVRMTETMACFKLEIPVKQWLNWKSKAKNKAKFADILTRMKAQRVDNYVHQIDLAATGSGGVRHDWRAAREMLNISAPELYEPRGNAQAVGSVAVMTEDKAKQLLSMLSAERVAVADGPTTSQLGDGQSAAVIIDATVVSQELTSVPCWVRDSEACTG